MKSILDIDSQQSSEQNQKLVLKDVTIHGDLRGTTFEAHVRQQFINTSATHAEVIYNFPLPWGAVLLGVEVQLGDKKLHGSVIGKTKAEEEYETSISNGDAAIMLERSEDGNYVLQLGNLAPGEQCVIDMHYGQSLQLNQGSLRLSIPTVIAPRYGDPIQDGGLAPHQVPQTDFLAEYGFNLTLNLHGKLANGRVASPSHPISMANDRANDLVTVGLANQSYLDRDFILIIDQLEQSSVFAIGEDYVDHSQYVVTASFNPMIIDRKEQKTVLKILVDCSGSMNGSSITTARRALIEVVKKLKEGDQFSLSKFGSTVEHRSRSLWSITDRTRVGAEQWITALEANMGGTDITEALESTIAQSSSGHCDILLITDGQTYDAGQTIKLSKESGHRIFVVGIGSSPTEDLLNTIADETKGAAEFVASGESVEPAVMKMFNRLRSPAISNVTVEWETDTAPIQVSTLDAYAFDGDILHVSAWFKTVPKGHVSLYGQLAGKEEIERIGSVVIDCAPSSSTGLSRIAAADREARATDSEEAEKIALAYQLVTKQTNFLMLHERSAEEKASGMPELHQVKQMLPAGWGGSAFLKSENLVLYSMKSPVPEASMEYGIPTVMRNSKVMRKISLKGSASDKIRNLEKIPAFLRRRSDVEFPDYKNGEIIRIKILCIWTTLNDAQEKVLAIMSQHPANTIYRVWFVNEKNEIFDYMDFDDLGIAKKELVLNGFSDFVRKRFSLLTRFRSRYVWKCVEDTRIYTNSEEWICS